MRKSIICITLFSSLVSNTANARYEDNEYIDSASKVTLAKLSLMEAIEKGFILDYGVIEDRRELRKAVIQITNRATRDIDNNVSTYLKQGYNCLDITQAFKNTLDKGLEESYNLSVTQKKGRKLFYDAQYDYSVAQCNYLSE